MRPVSLAAAAAVVLLAAGLAACDSSGADAPPLITQPSGTSVLVPLAVGNTWVFERTETRYANDGTVIGETTASTPDTLRVVGTETHGGATWYRLASSPSSPSGLLASAAGGLVANREDGYYSWFRANALRQYAYPARAGDVYGVTMPFSLDSTQYYSFQNLVTVKRTDHPLNVTDTPGVMYTSNVITLRVGDRDYGVPSWNPGLRTVIAPGVGFGILECGFHHVHTGQAVMSIRYRYRLLEFRPAQTT